MNVDAIIKGLTKAAQVAGSNQAVFKELLEQFKLLGSSDRATLETALAKAEAKADAAHADLQRAAGGQ